MRGVAAGGATIRLRAMPEARNVSAHDIVRTDYAITPKMNYRIDRMKEFRNQPWTDPSIAQFDNSIIR